MVLLEVESPFAIAAASLAACARQVCVWILVRMTSKGCVKIEAMPLLIPAKDKYIGSFDHISSRVWHTVFRSKACFSVSLVPTMIMEKGTLLSRATGKLRYNAR